MQETQINTLDNFTIMRDGQLSRWETARPVIRDQLRTFRGNLNRGLLDFLDSFDDVVKQNSVSLRR